MTEVVTKSVTEPGSAAKPIYIATLHRPGDLIGGIQKHYTVFAAEAHKRGYSATVLTPFHAPKALWFPLFGLGKALAYVSKPLHAWWYEYTRLGLLKRVLAARVSRQTASVIYAQDPVSAEAALSLRARGYPVEVVSAVHFNLSTADEWAGKGYLEPGGLRYRRMLARDARVLPQLDRLVFVSQFMARRVAERLPQLSEVSQWVVPNFVPYPPSAPNTPLQAELISVGTLEPRKNQLFLLEVLARLHARGYPYRLTLVGDGPLRHDLRSKARALGLDAFVTLLGNLPDAAGIIRQHRVYLHAAKMENLPLVLIEALAAGKPVFAAPVGGIPEVFSDGVEGYYWSLDDPDAAATKLIRVLEDRAHYEALSKAARERHAQHFSTDAVQNKLMSAVLGEDAIDY